LEIQNVYLIKDLAQITGFSVDTIKYYSKLGLIKEEGRSPGTNFRYFGNHAAKRLAKIRHYRTQGQSLKQIRSLLSQESAPEQKATSL